METIFEVILEIIFEIVIIWIFQYPGAFIRWLFLQKKRSFKSIIDEDPYINAGLSITLIVFAVMGIRYLIN